MECIVCEEDFGGHRIVLDIDSRAPIGGFCFECESTIFGGCFERFSTDDAGNCVICDHSAEYVFLDWLDQRDTEELSAGASLEAPEWGESPAFCRTHLQVLTSNSTAWVPKGTTPRVVNK
jgi:hypothetical protein